jgi:Mlc titration factor MtfA (ptsG expression regulator)
MSIQNEIHLLKTVFLPLLNHYLTNQISAKTFETQYTEARRITLDKFEIETPAEISKVIEEVFFDVDAVWINYDPNDPDHVERYESLKDYFIFEPELRQRTITNYQTMLALIEKYDKT